MNLKWIWNKPKKKLKENKKIKVQREKRKEIREKGNNSPNRRGK